MFSMLVSDFVIGMLPEKDAVYRGTGMRSMGEIAGHYLLGRDVSKGYASNIRRTAAKMDAAGITPASIDGANVNIWLSSLRTSGLSPVSIRSERRSAITIWRHGIEIEVIANPIRHVVQPKVPRRVTRAFRRSDLTAAVNTVTEKYATEKFKGSGCPKGLWLVTWTMFVYETGARFTDAYELRGEALVHGGVAWTASKTGLPVIKRLSQGTAERLQQLLALSPDGTVFRWAVSRRHAFAAIRKSYEESGLTGGRTQWLRRSGATHAEMDRKGAAMEYLAHATPGLAETNYIDFTQLLDRLAAPKPLG
jgi:hypothetical protein